MDSGKKIILFCLLWISSFSLAGQERYATNPLIYRMQDLPAVGIFYSNKRVDTQTLIKQLNYANTIVLQQQDSAIYLLEDVLAKSRVLKYDGGIAAALANLGRISNINGRYEQANDYYRRARPYAIRGFRNRTSLAMYYNAASGPFYNMARFDSMYYYVTKAEQLVKGIVCQTLREVVDVSAINNNIALLWAGVGDYKKSLHYLHRSVTAINSFSGNRGQLNPEAGMIYGNIGVINLTLKHFDSAALYLHIADSLLPENPITLIGLGDIEAHNGNPVKADAFFHRAIIFAERANDYQNTITAKARLGLLHFEQKNYQPAKILLNEVVRMSVNKGNIDLENACHAYEALSSIAASEGDYKLAYEQEQQSLRLLDTLKVKEKMLSVYTLEAQLAAANQDKLTAKQQLLMNKTKTKLILWLVVASAGVLSLGGLLLVLYRNAKNRQRLQMRELSVVRQGQEIKDLQSMIKGEEKERARMAREIHDGIMVQFSTIKMKMKSVPDNYRSLASATYLETDYYRELIAEMEDATRDLRSTAHNLMPDMLLQGGLEDAILYFCNGIRRSTDIDIEYQKHGNLSGLNKEFELSIYRIIQELFQNVIKHADATKILVQTTMLADNLLTITVEDNGKGYHPGKEPAGLGLVSINNRLKVMNGFMDISSAPGQGTSVNVALEL